MSRTNQYLAGNSAGMVNPITFAGTNKAKVAQVTALISMEATDGTDHRLFLDEMSPAARDSLYAILTALEASIVNTV